MAFHQPTRPAMQRPQRVAEEERELSGSRPGSSSLQRHQQPQLQQVPPPDLHECQTWILFSPATDATTTTTSSYLEEPRAYAAAGGRISASSTPGRSRLSDLGSLGTAGGQTSDGRFRRDDVLLLRSPTASSEVVVDEDDDESVIGVDVDAEGAPEDGDEEDAELDSLDSHLASFRSGQVLQPQRPAELSLTREDGPALLRAVEDTGTPVLLPSHDGLGSFRLDRVLGSMRGAGIGIGLPPQEGATLQDQLYAFERFNPRRVRTHARWRGGFDSLGRPTPAAGGMGMGMGDGEGEEEENFGGAFFFPSAAVRGTSTADEMVVDEEHRAKMRRIEAWRAEQGRFLLEEIQRETRRRRRASAASASRASAVVRLAAQQHQQHQQQDGAVGGRAGSVAVSVTSSLKRQRDEEDGGAAADDGQTWHDQQEDNDDEEDGRSTPLAKESLAAGGDGKEQEEDDDEGIWARITRVVVRDLMGIDDGLLSILFGEGLPADVAAGDAAKTDAAMDHLAYPQPQQQQRPESTVAAPARNAVGSSINSITRLSALPSDGGAFDLAAAAAAAAQADDDDVLVASTAAASSSSWQERVLARISRELGVLMHQLSADPHPGAFGAYVRVRDATLPYGGLPVIPERLGAAVRAQEEARAAVVPDEAPRTAPLTTNAGPSASKRARSELQFGPTVAAMPRPSGGGGREQLQQAPSNTTTTATTTAAGPHDFTQDEWEQDLDIRLVFRYLRARFSRSSSPATAAAAVPTAPPSASLYTASSAFDGNPANSTASAAAKAARVRQYHPLISQQQQQQRRSHPHHQHYGHHHYHLHSSHGGLHHIDRRPSFKSTAAASSAAAAVVVPPVMRTGSSVASTTRRRGSVGSSSRHYWDIGALSGTGGGGEGAGGGGGGAGSAAGTGSLVSSGPMGSWGEV